MISIHDIHPISVREIKKSHPWITKDSYSLKFNKNADWIKGQDQNNEFIGFFLHDPTHPFIKARIWTKNPLWKDSSFENDLQERLSIALKKRNEIQKIEGRDHFYLVFGEADLLPGLFIIEYLNEYLIQFYSSFWESRLDRVTSFIEKIKNELALKNVWIQARSEKMKAPAKMIKNRTKSELKAKELSLSYDLHLGENYDPGLYTDMSHLRFEMKKIISPKETCLNLFSYTGAFSLWAMEMGFKNCLSVDLSSKYLNWLKDNLNFNTHIKSEHESWCESSQTSIKKLLRSNQKFDLIICDPPSASSDGKKITSAMDSYRTLFPELANLLKPDGHLITFLNTHRVSRKKAKDNFLSIKKNNPDLKNLSLLNELSLGADCSRLPYFPEGDYLKGFIWTKRTST
jgi:23S rRNA (cytosine1962-C5)-methyltransferase